MVQFLWKWAVFTAIDTAIAVVAVALFGGHMTGAALGIVALAGALLLIAVFVGALLWLRVGGDTINAPAAAVIAGVVVGVVVVGVVGWGWLKSVVETDWRFWLLAVALPCVAALQIVIGHAGRPRPSS